VLLLLFDIDGTLLRGATEAHALAMTSALHEVYAVGPGDPPSERAAIGSFAGRTDIDIARELATAWGCERARFDEGVAELEAACAREYERLVPEDLSRFCVPGIGELLDELGAWAEVMLALLTGNLEQVARLKLERAGLGRHFRHGQGAFGSDGERREMLPAIARARAGAEGRLHPRERTIVIGDTPRDIACARADRVRCIAVTSGLHGADELSGADAVATSTPALRELIGAQLRASRL
jgi:phosphoglycolate phosphatase-like HAD superfamily hydrolase